MRVVGFVPDLMDRSKVAAAGPGVRFVGLDELSSVEADLVVVDLGRPGVLDALPVGVRCIGFGSHVDTALLDAARAAGCEAMPRSRFFASLPDLLA